jgi:hypothetical protein
VRPGTFFEAWQKTCRSRVFLALFMAYSSQFLGFSCQFTSLRRPGTFLDTCSKTRFFRVLCKFSWVIVHNFRVLLFYKSHETRYIFLGMAKTRRFRLLWHFSWAIAHGFRIFGRFTSPVRPGAFF